MIRLVTVHNIRRVPTGNPLHARDGSLPELRAEASRPNEDDYLTFSTKSWRRLHIVMLCYATLCIKFLNTSNYY